MKRHAKKDWRHLFVLTPEEKRTLFFVVAAVVLGLGAKNHRQKHSVSPAKTAIVEVAKNAGLPAEKRAEVKRQRAGK